MSEQPRRQSRANTPQTNRHLTGRYRSDAPPPAERGRPEDRVQRPGCFLMIGLLVAGASAALVAVIALFFLLPDWTRRPSPAAKELVLSAARS